MEHSDWNAAHKDMKPDTRQQPGRAGQCTRCGMTNHMWRQCPRDAVISTVGQRKPFQTQKRGFSGRSHRPQVSRTLRIQNQVPQQITQIVRPKSWETDMDESKTQCPGTTGDGRWVFRSNRAGNRNQCEAGYFDTHPPSSTL